MMEGGMEVCNGMPMWQAPELAQPPVEPSWEDMLNAFLQVPEDSANVEEVVKNLGGSDCEAFQEIGTDSDFVVSDDLLWSGGVSDAFPDFCESLLNENDGNLPALSSEVSSLADDDHLGPDGRGSGGAVLEGNDDVDELSPNSIDAVPQLSLVSNNDSDDASAAPSPTANSPADVKVSSPDTVGDSSDVGASGKSCDNFASLSERQDQKSPDLADDDTKRESRLRRNRESASQSRMRKKSYMKDIEAKCRAMESQLGMLHQTVAFFSSQNAALREELALVKSSKGHGSKSGAMEPAALPSDSLPSESPSRRTTFLTVQWVLVVFLFHVSLLMLSLPVLLPLPSLAANGGNSRNEALKADTRQSGGTSTRDIYSPLILMERMKEENDVFGDSLRPFDRPFSLDPGESRMISILA